MPEETIEARLDAIEQQIEQATEALESIRTELQIGARIESANTREIDKLKGHVAKLQRLAQPVGPLPDTLPNDGE